MNSDDLLGLIIISVLLIILCFFTCIIESVPVLLMTRSFKRWCKASFKCNIITNPLLNTLLLLISNLFRSDGALLVIYIIGESAVVFVESFLYKYILRENSKKCFMVSLVANIISFSVGMLIMYLFNRAWNSPGPGGVVNQRIE